MTERTDRDRLGERLTDLGGAVATRFEPPPMEYLRAARRRRAAGRIGLAALATATVAGLGGGAFALADRSPAPRPVPARPGRW